MTRYLYLEGAGGISGDMTVAALLDLGADQKKLDAVLDSLRLDGFEHHIERKNSYSISGLDFDVHVHAHEHSHESVYHDGHHHEHRHLKDVYEIIERGNMSVRARELAKKIFLIVAEAEAKAHGTTPEEVHFHEVGAIDSIVDIVATAVLVDDLGIDSCIVTALTEGSGTIQCQHGILPVPVPAVLNIAEKYRIPLRPSATQGEMVTPTGIAIAAALRTAEKLPLAYKVLQTGIGLGKRDFGHANFLRVMILEDTAETDQIYVMETNIDDSTPEELGLTMEKLMTAGALDVHFEPCLMKKNRPAYMLRVIATAAKLPLMQDLVFRTTSTIGLRYYPVERTCMNRRQETVPTEYGAATVKISTWKDIVRCRPEFESIKKLAGENGDFGKIYRCVQAEAEKLFGQP